MNAAPLDSPRLAAVLAFLRTRGEAGATTREIIEATSTCAVNSTVAEIRAGGCNVDCRCEGVAASGARIYRYRLLAGPGSEVRA